MVHAAYKHLKDDLCRTFPSVRFLATAFWIGWVLLIYSGEVFGNAVNVLEYDTTSYFFSTTAVSLTFFIGGIFGPKHWGFIRSARTTIIGGVLCAIGTAGVIGASFISDELCCLGVSFFANLATGSGSGLVALRCATQYAEVSPRRIFATSSIMLVLAMLVYSTVLSFPFALRVALTACMPLLAALCALFENDIDASAFVQGTSTIPKEFWRFVAAVFILAIIFSVSRGFYPQGLDIDEFNLSRGIVSSVTILICLFIALLAVVGSHSVGFGRMGYRIIVLCILVAVLAPIVGLQSVITGVAFSIANSIIGSVVWSLLGSLSSLSGISSLRIYGLGFSAFMMGSTIGWPIGFVIDSLSLDSITGVLALALSVVVLLTLVLLFREKDLDLLVYASDEDLLLEPAGLNSDDKKYEKNDASEQEIQVNSEGSIGVSRPRWRERVMQIAAEGKLSSREEEVLQLMAKGHNARSISEELSVSYNTARTHVRNIYTKLDVHSRTEFQRLID